jgi:CRP-like cAMP-binding protein
MPFSANKLLNGMPADDLSRLSPNLKLIPTPRGFTAARRYRAASHVYFPTSGLISIVGSCNKHDIELGIAGREGMVGVTVVLGFTTTPYECFSQIGGEAFQLPVSDLNIVLDESPTLLRYLNRYVYAFQVQLSETAVSHGLQKIESRLARWLLICQDRHEGKLPIAHEFLAMMLGVRRAGVTTAMDKLRTDGLIISERGSITILNRDALAQLAGSTYGVSEAEYEIAMGFSV